MQWILRSGIRSRFAIAGAALSAAAFAGPVEAGLIIDLGGGWECEIVAAPTDFADVNPDGVDVENDRLFIQKFWEFLTLDEFSGQPDPAHIMFRQIAPDEDTVSQIVINNEVIVNHTGVAWTSYQNSIVGNAARFNPALSAGFDVSPFTDLTFSNNNQTATASGGVLPSGDTPWTPGLAGGALVIDIDLSGTQPAKFLLKELPGIIPAPGALSVLALGLVAARRRRRGA